MIGRATIISETAKKTIYYICAIKVPASWIEFKISGGVLFGTSGPSDDESLFPKYRNKTQWAAVDSGFSEGFELIGTAKREGVLDSHGIEVYSTDFDYHRLIDSTFLTQYGEFGPIPNGKVASLTKEFLFKAFLETKGLFLENLVSGEDQWVIFNFKKNESL
jgi:hypothetical protein